MIKKLLLLVVVVLSAFTTNAQTISIVGEAVGGWPDGDPLTPDTHIMSTVDNITYTISNLVVTTATPTPDGGAKFRQDGDWGTNWGSTAFPSGTGSQNGNNILTVAGTYDITFNRLTGAYNFTSVTAFPSIGIIGTVNGESGFDLPDVDMVTFDGIAYKLTSHTFVAGEAKFRMNDSWTTNWGSNDFPSGTATMGGANIPVPAGTFTVTFNIQTGAYSFEYPSIGILGTAVNSNGFDGPDTNLTTTDGITYTLINHEFTTGEAKFRLNDAWDTNWGNAAFPTGTGTQGGDNIIVTTAGTYTVTFNRLTGDYSFGAPVVFPVIGIIGTAVLETGFDGEDVDMATTDGINYTLENYVFVNGEAKFRMDNAWITSWGGPSFPNGTALLTGVNIPVTAGTYTVTFNRNSLSYTFVGTPTFPTVGILGTAVNANGFGGPDVNMTTIDGENYTLSNYTFTAGEAKFRQDDAWDINWGSANFPSGTANLSGANIIVLAGTFNVAFNRMTGVYSFSIPGEFPSVGILGTAVNAAGFDGPDTNLSTTDGIVYTLTDFTLSAGEAKFRQDDSWDLSWGGAFPSGTAVVGGANFAVTPGTYNITFNRLSLVYSFSGDSFPSIGIIGTAAIATGFDGADVDMTTYDGINYNLNAHEFVNGEAKFRQDNSWDLNWGDVAFPTGMATENGANILVTGNRYNVYFNRLTANYAFNYVSIGIIGTAVNTFEVPDTDLATIDGITYTITLQLLPGEFKLRENDNWNVNWGGAAFPSDTYTQNGQNVLVTTGGEYSISFNRVTGEFNATLLGVGEFNSNSFKVYPNPSNSVWNFTSVANGIKSVQIADVLGKVILTQNTSGKQVSIDAQSLPNGLYFAKVTSDNGSKTIKLIKN